jgi:hypothetical protein
VFNKKENNNNNSYAWKRYERKMYFNRIITKVSINFKFKYGYFNTTYFWSDTMVDGHEICLFCTTKLSLETRRYLILWFSEYNIFIQKKFNIIPINIKNYITTFFTIIISYNLSVIAYQITWTFKRTVSKRIAIWWWGARKEYTSQWNFFQYL